ncbi:MAG: replication-associated recombination protein A, partial [Acidimicrobiales bacterium]
DAVRALVGLADGDARAVLTTLEVALALAGDRPITLADVERARHTRLQHYGEDAHYDQASALIKSIRGSDPDAGLYWLARMLESGEDARFIARRLVILASEDVGEADPLSLVVADAAARAVEFVGLPEAQLNLAQAVVHLACAPKSNRVTVALGRARRDVRDAPRGDVPSHLRDAHYRSAAAIGHGEGYQYPHDHPGAFVAQEYRPAEVSENRYYEPSDRGHEAVVAERLRQWRADATAEVGDGDSGDDDRA